MSRDIPGVIIQRVRTRALDDNNVSSNQNKNNSNEIIAKNSVLMIYSGPACYKSTKVR